MACQVIGVNTIVGTALATLAGAALTGCAARPATVQNPIEIDASEYSRMFLASAAELRNQGFILDRQDFRFGVLTTKPVASPTALEPWHTANRTAAHAVDSTFNDQRRRVTVTFNPPESGGADPSIGAAATPDVYLLRVDVQIERRQVPLRYMTGSTSGRNLMGTLRRAPIELSQRGILGAYWQPIGRDPALEHHLMAAIVRASMQTTTNDDPPTTDAP